MGLVEVCDGVYVAAAAAVATCEPLSERGVTHVLNVTPDAPMPGGGSGEPFVCLRVPVADDADTPLHEHLEAAAQFIHAAISPQTAGRACAFCATGASAAPAIVAYYLMRHRGLPLADALTALDAACEGGVRLNGAFWQRLVEAESWLLGASTPSVSIQQLKWRHLERAFPDAASREETLAQLTAGRAEASELLRARLEWSST